MIKRLAVLALTLVPVLLAADPASAAWGISGSGPARNQAVVVPGAVNAALAAGVRFTPRAAARRIAGRLQR